MRRPGVRAKHRIITRLCEHVVDRRDPDRIEPRVRKVITRRLCALALGYEDIDDDDPPRHDPSMATAAGKDDPTSQGRAREPEGGEALVGFSTLNRLEFRPEDADRSTRYRTIPTDPVDKDGLRVELSLDAHGQGPAPIWPYLDARTVLARVINVLSPTRPLALDLHRRGAAPAPPRNPGTAPCRHTPRRTRITVPGGLVRREGSERLPGAGLKHVGQDRAISAPMHQDLEAIKLVRLAYVAA